MGKYRIDKFQKYAEELDIQLSANQYQQFIDYYELLIEWNKIINLTTITNFDEVVIKHFIDSLSLTKAIDLNSRLYIIDVGTGAGFPGIPLKIAFPNLDVTLLDSLNKRIKFLNEVISNLSLCSIKTIHGRAEDFAKSNDILRETYDLSVSRAVANLATLSEYCLPFVKKGGLFISYKSEKIGEEINAASKGIQILGGNIENQIEFNLPGCDIYRNLCMVRKINFTPKKFPRKAGLPSKEPLN